MYSFVDLGLVVLFALSLTAVYFAFEKFITIRALSFLLIRKYIIDTVTGMFFGLFTILFTVILNSLDSGFTIPLYFIIGIIFVTVRNINVAAPAFIISLIYNVFRNDFANIDYFIISFFALVIFIKLVVGFYTEEKWANLSVIIGITLMGLIGIVVIGSAFNYSYGRTTYENSILLSAATAVVYYPFRTAVRFSISANLLFESVNYIFSRYYRSSLIQGAIGSYISQHKTKKAIFGLFEMKINGAETQDEKDEVVKTVLTKVDKYFNDETTLFSYDQNIYGFFMPTDENIKLKDIIDGNHDYHKNNILNEIEGLIQIVSGSYETTSHNIVDVSMRVGTSLYGIQSNSILTLEGNALYALGQIEWESDNKVINFSFEKYRKKVKDSSRLALMDDILDLNNFSNRYKPLFDKSGKYSNIQFVSVENNSDYELVQNVDELVRMNRWKFTFDRYFAAEAISKNKTNNTILMFEYSQLFDQSLDEYIEFIDRLIKGIKSLKKVILVLSMKDINKTNVQNIKRITNDGIKWAISDWQLAQQVNELNPDYALVNQLNINEVPKVKSLTIYPKAQTESELIEAVKMDVDIFGGAVIHEKSYVKKPDKQSKTYIINLINSLRREE